MVFVNNFSPFLFKFPGTEFGIRWYGLAYLVGFAIAYFTLKNAVKQGRIPNFQEKSLEPLLYGIVAGVVGGGRLGYCIQHPDRLFSDPLYFFKFQEGGMAFFGGLVGVIIALFVFCKKTGVRFGYLGDTVAIPAAVSLGIGRIANFINGELWGVPTGSDWGVIYARHDQVPRHPSELYECTTHFLLALVLFIATKSPKFRDRPGTISCLFVIVYGLLRTITEHFREADRYVGPLTNGQVASLVIALLGAIALAWVWRKESKLAPDAAVPDEIPEIS